MYEYNKILKNFKQVLSSNHERANLKKSEYLNKISSIFKQFISKCEKQIDFIISSKIQKLYHNYQKVQDYIEQKHHISEEQTNLIIAQFLIRPFEKFPFTGHKNQKIFREQYSLIQKASVLIEQTLTQSFKQDEVPTFENRKFFETIEANGIGRQSLTKLRLNPQNFSIHPLHQIAPKQTKINSIVKLNSECIMCVGEDNFIQVWDILEQFCVKKFHIDVPAKISTLCVAKASGRNLLFAGFSDQNPMIMSYETAAWKKMACNISHTRKITKLLANGNNHILSGSADGVLCIHDIHTLKTLISSSHVSGIEDIFTQNSFVYILQKNSAVLQYDLNLSNISLNFRRSISAGYISMIRFPQLTTNFSGIGCHIYGISQIEISRKFKMQQTNIINVAEMISDFILLQSKQTSEYFALCVFQNSSAIRIYSLTTQEQVYEYSAEYCGQVGASCYLPKLELTSINGRYILTVVSQSEFEDDPNIVKCYQLAI